MNTSTALSLAVISFLLTVIWGQPLIRVLKQLRVGDVIQVELREMNITKMGTPTMGGVLIVLPVLLITALLNAAPLIGRTLIGRSVLVPLGTLVAYALLGAIDDAEKVIVRRREGLGISARTKFIVQVVFALGLALFLKYALRVPDLFVPGVRGPVPLGIWWVPLAMFIIVGTSNAMNITDGMDGLGEMLPRG